MREAYIENLRAASDEANQRHEEVRAKTPGADPRVLCDTPLTDQVEALMRSLPPVQRDRPWSMDEFVARLQGRYSARPHPMNVGNALRALGWESRRNYKREGGGRRIWLLPI